MLSPKKLIQIFRRWQKAVALRRRRIMSANIGTAFEHPVACRGHIFVYTVDNKRFMVPLKYLSSPIFQVLFKMSEEEYGLPSDGPIMLPCDAECMDCIIALVQNQKPEDLDTELVLASISGNRCTISSVQPSQPLMLYGF